MARSVLNRRVATGTVRWGLLPLVVALAAAGLTSARQPSSIALKGMTLVAYGPGLYSLPSTDESLERLARTGANWLALVVTGYQETFNATAISHDSLFTPTDADLAHVIELSHRFGLKVMLKPAVDLSHDPTHWRGDIGTAFLTEEAWGRWFASYRGFIYHYAVLAQDSHVDLLSIGAELVGTTDRERDWRVVIAGVRAVFQGPITYAANWGGEETRMRWWDAVDYIGVNAYYPLTRTPNPTVDELKDAWITKSYVGMLERLARTFNKQLILTEIGYRSIDGAVGAPWDFETAGAVNVQEQANAYQAALETFWDRRWLAGFFWWNWEIDPNAGGPNDRGYTPQQKPAEQILTAFYRDK